MKRWFLVLAICGFAAAGCAGERSVVPLSPTAATPQMHRSSLRSGTGQVVFSVSIFTGTPGPRVPVELATDVHSIGGKIGDTAVKPVTITQKAPQCRAAGSSLVCNVMMRAKAGLHQKLVLKAFSGNDGTGSVVDNGRGYADVYAGYKNYEPAPEWYGVVKQMAIVFSPSELVGGILGGDAITPYGVDPAGSLVMTLPPPGTGRVTVTATGPYLLRASTTVGTPVGLRYDGVQTGSEQVEAVTSKMHAKATLNIVPGTSAAAKTFTQVDISNSDVVYQFAGGYYGNAAPLRELELAITRLVAADSTGGFWCLSGNSQVNHYDRYGNLIAVVPARYAGSSPSNTPFIGAATVDSSGNAYVVDELRGSVPQIDVYAAGSYGSPVRSIAVQPSPVPSGNILPLATTDGSGDVWIDYASHLLEYGPTASGTPAPLRTVVSGGISLAADPAGNLYMASGYNQASVAVIHPDGTTGEIVVPGDSYTLSTAADSSGNVFIGFESRTNPDYAANYEIGVVPAGGSTVTQIIVPATALGPDSLSASLAVAP